MVAPATPLLLSPMQTTGAINPFPKGASSEGLVQGVAYDDPSARNRLASGVLDGTEVPMWAGMAITANIPKGSENGGTVRPLGCRLRRATGMANLSGFSILNQAHHALTSPGLPVPLFLPNMTVHFSRFGSMQRVALQIDPNLAAAIEDGYDGVQVSWDFVNQQIIAFNATVGALPGRILDVNIGNSIVAQMDPVTGAVTYNYYGTCAIFQF